MRAVLLATVVAACADSKPAPPPIEQPFVMVLGIAQDAGYPQAACRKECCAGVWRDPSKRRDVASLAIVSNGKRWIIDCTPDFKDQLRRLDGAAPAEANPGIEGVFLTHAHIGHYAGLVHLGREVMGAKRVPVFAMARMHGFLSTNGPWNLIVSANHVALQPLVADTPVALDQDVEVTPFLVPHRDEYSETVGFRIDGPGRSVLFIPDIDKWERWDRQIEEAIAAVDVAYLDGTFFKNGEIPGRDMAQIPHPFIEESLARFAKLPAAERGKIRFIHLNHTNPALFDETAVRQIRAAGCSVAKQGERVSLR